MRTSDAFSIDPVVWFTPVAGKANFVVKKDFDLTDFLGPEIRSGRGMPRFMSGVTMSGPLQRDLRVSWSSVNHQVSSGFVDLSETFDDLFPEVSKEL